MNPPKSVAALVTVYRRHSHADAIVGEHGDYPKNARGQTRYPRRRLFAEAAEVFEKSGRSVPKPIQR